ncbi:alpha/beta fold hydrolase [Reyranella soli]|uniref:Alpha/beta hydrolase n=1 Tax=Reyranella soli TaxID=1230389 RepID=A0A512NL34_9HYPH|nr:alpha/beta fold hydrolase [Reyranella soli]GEP59656.1 hypothetical protein RSO01_68220 [Reyranella soli]
MASTVYFATNRVIVGPKDKPGSYTSSMVPSANPAEVIYGTAFVGSADFEEDKPGNITSLHDFSDGMFNDPVNEDLSKGGRNILVFIHGFANTFGDAIARAAFNREWFANHGISGTDTAVIAFSWPSRGQVVSLPLPWDAYRHDQEAATNSGMHLLRFLSNLLPMLEKARENGRRTFLLAHSMGNLALQGAVGTWFAQGNGEATMFDEVILAAPDVKHTAFGNGASDHLHDLHRLAQRISVLYSRADKVLDDLSEIVNGGPRLGQRGPYGMGDLVQFPAKRYQMVDCTGFNDYKITFQGSHQYYRISRGVRATIAALMTA